MRKNETEKNRDEVEELLRAAQDELLLKLSLDSHIASSSSISAPSSTTLDVDLERRFQALKSSQSSWKGDDLFTRFDALKVKSNPSLKQASLDPSTGEEDEDEDEDEDDQVEKLIQWAKDAARLEPSASSDDDDSEQQNQDRRKAGVTLFTFCNCAISTSHVVDFGNFFFSFGNLIQLIYFYLCNYLLRETKLINSI
ncbi:uncharacterized protein LOC129322524 [Prosopis cineraria]|uniref:uncharacterized protein LOC129322524 n=1 Tax=Prosopis cineraria TaxID=364024 RepID=UPI00240FAE8C|nr:uncharacterized protein LOC129322524 [Prosopis cineraria]